MCKKGTNSTICFEAGANEHDETGVEMVEDSLRQEKRMMDALEKELLDPDKRLSQVSSVDSRMLGPEDTLNQQKKIMNVLEKELLNPDKRVSQVSSVDSRILGQDSRVSVRKLF